MPIYWIAEMFFEWSAYELLDVFCNLSCGPISHFGTAALEDRVTSLVFLPFLSRWSSDARRPMSARERTIGKRLASFFWFWWWCCLSSVSRTFFLSSSPSGEYNSWWSKTMSKVHTQIYYWIYVPVFKLRFFPIQTSTSYQEWIIFITYLDYKKCNKQI